MATLNDFTLDGKEDSSGQPVIVSDSKCISEALKIFLTSKKGDFLFTDAGGILQRLMFKNINSEQFEELAFDVRTTLENEFTPTITIDDLSFELDKIYKILTMNIKWSASNGDIQGETILNLKTPEPEKVTRNYQDITLVEDALYNFVVAKKPDFPGELLSFNYDLNSWVWGYNYKFSNLTDEDIRFSDILEEING